MVDFNQINPNVRIPRGISKPESKPTEEIKDESSKTLPETNYKSADDVLSFMAQSNFSNVGSKETTSTRKIEVSKYVTPEQAKRIAGFIQEFEGAVAKGLIELDNEFSALPEYKDMSDSAKYTIAAGTLEFME
ncbi:MAG: hypothetical protein PHV68_06010 [Candidatus Gastranaerophilales bacterium]|nr:hypothetical protein [Candidatus Gastranaerophilales bacterium]